MGRNVIKSSVSLKIGFLNFCFISFMKNVKVRGIITIILSFMVFFFFIQNDVLVHAFIMSIAIKPLHYVKTTFRNMQVYGCVVYVYLSKNTFYMFTKY